MSFAQPLALFGLLFVPLIILFYLLRSQHQRQVISSTWLWAEALERFSHRPARRLPLREPLLLLQLLAVLVLTLFFAGPRFSQAAHAHQIVVLDGSVAMAATDISPSRFARARQRVEDIIAKLGPEDSLSIILAGPHARVVGELPSDMDVATAVRRLATPSGDADIAGAVALARGVAAASGVGSPRVTFLAAPETPPLAVGTLPINVERIGKTPLDDQGIGALSARCQSDGVTCAAFARIRNSAAAPRTDDLAVWADGQSLGRQTLHIPALGSLDLTFALPKGARAIKASLLGHDAIASNDTAWALVPAPPRLHALFVSDSPGQMLRGLHAVPGLTVDTIPASKFQYADFGHADLLILDKVSPDNLPPIPLLAIDPPTSTSFLNVRAANVFLPVDNIDVSDPLAQGLDLYGLATNGEKIDTPPWAHVVVGGANGALLMDGVQNASKTAVLAFDAGHNPFAQDVAFPLLVTRLVNWLVPAPPASVPAGASVWLPAGVQTVQDPSGAVLAGPMVNAARQGMYSVKTGTGNRLPGQALFAVSTANPGEVVSGAGNIPVWVPPVSTGTLWRNVWPLAVLLALVVVSGEWWFYAKKT
ncbi:MAG: conserved hypothetical rane protein [Chloroflexi bacterium]|nr:conserved hypothetical rane protein [Chloroflexota bacterium]